MQDLVTFSDYVTFFISSVKKLLTLFWEQFALVVWNLFLIFFVEVLVNLQGILAILYIIWQTLGIYVAAVLLVLYLFDVTEDYARAQFKLPPRPELGVTWVNRGCAFAAILWPMSELFLYFGEIVDSFSFLSMLEHDYLRGIIFFISFAPFNNAIISIFVFRELIRRRGPDTKWFGQTAKYWIKHFVRYCWCFTFCIHIMIQLFMYIFIKFAVASGLEGSDQEQVALAFFFMMLALMVYGGICAILGLQPRFPLFHGACLVHCGRLKGSKGN